MKAKVLKSLHYVQSGEVFKPGMIVTAKYDKNHWLWLYYEGKRRIRVFLNEVKLIK